MVPDTAVGRHCGRWAVSSQALSTCDEGLPTPTTAATFFKTPLLPVPHPELGGLQPAVRVGECWPPLGALKSKGVTLSAPANCTPITQWFKCVHGETSFISMIETGESGARALSPDPSPLVPEEEGLGQEGQQGPEETPGGSLA